MIALNIARQLDFLSRRIARPFLPTDAFRLRRHNNRRRRRRHYCRRRSRRRSSCRRRLSDRARCPLLMKGETGRN